MKLAALRFLPIMLILFLAGCDQAEQTADSKQQQYRWSEYISAHTAGTISKYSAIRVRFVHDVASNEQLGKPVELLKVKPAIPGQAVFINPRELVLEPGEPLSSGKTYQLTLSTNGLKGIPDALSQYQFKIDVIKQDFEIQLDGISTDPGNDTIVSLSGTLTTADKEAAEPIEKILSANYLDQTRKLEWEHNADGRHHRFIIAGLPRQQEDKPLTLSWNGDSIKVDNHGERTVEIPATGVFKLTGIKAVQADRQYVELSFSDAIDKDQNLRGLVTMSSGDASTRVEDILI